MHITKFKAENTGIFRHNERLTLMHSNEQIDTSKSNENVYLVKDGLDRYNLMIEHDALMREKLEKQSLKKNAVTFCGLVLTLPKEYTNKTKAEQVQFFSEARKVFSDIFGADSELSVSMHFDETTPHMHYTFAPLDSDKCLNARAILTRDFLKSFHERVDKEMKQRVSWYRGGIVAEDIEDRQKDNLELEDYKELKKQEKEKKQELSQVKNEIASLSQRQRDIETVATALSEHATEILKEGSFRDLSKRDSKALKQLIDKKLVESATERENALKTKILSGEQKTERLEQELENTIKEKDYISKAQIKLFKSLVDTTELLSETQTKLHDTLLHSQELTQKARDLADDTTLTQDEREEIVRQDEKVKDYEEHNKKVQEKIDNINKTFRESISQTPSLFKSVCAKVRSFIQRVIRKPMPRLRER